MASRVRLATRLLEQLAEHGIVSLPAKRPRPRGPDRAVALTERTAPQPPLAADLASLRPLRLDAVADRPGFAAWQEWVARYHPLGYRKPLGCYVAYFLRDCRERLLGCLLFDPAARRLPCRDEWIGWQDEPYHAHLQLVVRNAHFLLLPWVQVKNLASHALALAARQLPADWHKLHRSRPLLLETYVNAEQHAGTCYKAAGWQLLGLTAGRKAHGRQPAQAPKQVRALPLRPDFRKLLRHGPFASRRRRPRAVAADAARRRRQFTALWEDLLAAIGDRLRRYDREWMQRRRKVNTLLVVLFVFRLVLAPRLQGYGPTLTELWGQCRQQGLFPPHDDPVSASSMCVARGKVGRRPFLRMHRALLARVPTDAPRWLWRGHRVCAVDGSKIHLPRRLRRDRYRCPSDRSHYPQGLLSSLFQLRARLPFDLDLPCHENERRAARDHLRALRPGDVVVFDRGYYSFALLHACARRGLHPVFRLQANASGLVRDFIQSDDADRTVPVEPTQTAPAAAARCRLAARPGALCQVHRRRQRLHPRDHPARPQALLQARPGRPLPCALGRGRTLQGRQEIAAPGALSRPVRGLGAAATVGLLHAHRDDPAVRQPLRGRDAVSGGQAAPAGQFQQQPADGQPACRMASAAAVGRAEHDGRQHPPQHGLLPPARASEPFLPSRHAQTRRPLEAQQEEMTGRPVLQSSKSIAQAPSTKRMPLREGAGTMRGSTRDRQVSLDCGDEATRKVCDQGPLPLQGIQPRSTGCDLRTALPRGCPL